MASNKKSVNKIIFNDNLNTKPNSKDADNIKLSNFYVCNLYIDNKEYYHIEGFYHSSKYINDDDKAAERIRMMSFPQLCKKIADKYVMDDNKAVRWENGEKCFVMKRALISKFITNTELAKYLVSTREAELIYNVLDEFWGAGKDGNGNNILGKMLMEVRTIVKSLADKYDIDDDNDSENE